MMKDITSHTVENSGLGVLCSAAFSVVYFRVWTLDGTSASPSSDTGLTQSVTTLKPQELENVLPYTVCQWDTLLGEHDKTSDL